MPLALQIAVVLALGVAAQWAAWRLRFPAIVLLLGLGLLLGNVSTPIDLHVEGDFYFALVSLAVAIILFEGGMSLDFREISGARGVVIRLTSLGLVVTWVLASALAYAVAGFSPRMAVLLGALLTVSGPTVVLPLLRHVQPVRRAGSLAKWEGIVNDPIGAVLAALVFEVILHPARQQNLVVTSLRDLGLTIVIGLGLGAIGSWTVVQSIKRYLLPDSLHNPLILSLVLLLFAASNALQHESGLLTVTVMGILLANQRTAPIRHVVEFKENLRVLLIATLFIVLAAQITVSRESLALLGWGSLAFALALVFVVRPVAVFACTIGAPLTWQEKVFLAWLHPRGIVAASVSALFALRIASVQGAESPLASEGERFVMAVYLVVIVSVTIYGLTLAPLARWLGLSNQNPQGVLFAGASRPVREIAAALRDEGFSVLLVDTNPRNNAAARMAGLPVLFASIDSEFVQEEIDLGGLGRLMAMTPNDEVNTLAAMGLTERFGRAGTYQLAIREALVDKREKVKASRRGRTLFLTPVTWQDLEARFEAGDKVKTTLITADFTYDDFLARYGDQALVMFRIDEAANLHIATSGASFLPRPGTKVIALIRAAAQDATAAT
jgi:NhaP-type Na+/H+ or K+/H+ antiporter